MIKIKIILAVLLLAALGGGIYYFSVLEQERMVAEEKAREERLVLQRRQAAEAVEQSKLKCADKDNYFVVTRDHDGNVGQDILVKNKVEGVTNDCRYMPADGDFEIKGEEAIYFKGINANALVTDIGTGPSGRSFKIYDLKDKNMVTEKSYFEVFAITDNVLTYFGPNKSLLKNKADAKKCKGEEVYVVKKTIDLKTYSAKETKEAKCVATQ